MAHKVVITLDDLEAAVRANAAFETAGFETVMVSALDDVRARVRHEDPDLLMLSGGLHEAATQRLVGAVRDGRVAILGLLEPTDADPAALAHRLGISAALVKPCDADEVVALGRRLIERKRLQERTGIIGEHPGVQEVLIKIEQLAHVSSTVLILGESGTGKELVARAIHDLSPRRAKAFIAVNCAALPETLLESELFGHEKGAFTGAAERRWRLVAATTRTLTRTVAVPPTRSNARSSSARRTFACSGSDRSPISSRKIVPPFATSNLPSFRPTAPVKAPFSCPNSSVSSNPSGMAAQLMATNGSARRALSA